MKYNLDHMKSDHAEILGAVSRAFKVKPKELLSKKRTEYLINPRFVFYHLLRKRGYTLQDVAHAAGRADHGSVIYGIQRLQDRLQTQRNLGGAVKELRAAGYEL